MTNWIMTVAHNNQPLLAQAVDSFLYQDVPSVRVLIINNGSTDGTVDWIHSINKLTDGQVTSMDFYPQKGVAHAWNAGLRWLRYLDARQVLVCNQDVWLRPDTYRLLKERDGYFVTAIGKDSYEDVVNATPHPENTRPHPDFSCFMISRSCFDEVGPFDEKFLGAYAEDSDYHCRMHKAGVEAVAIDLPFYHVGGGAQTIKYALPEAAEQIGKQANENRQRFLEKWGFEVGSPEYYAFFKQPVLAGFVE